MMTYSPAYAIANVIVTGLLDQQLGYEAVTDELRKAIAKLGADKPSSLTIETVFATSSIPGDLADGLRRMRKHPGLKVEAIISELRRAEGYFIKAHDSYIAGYTDRGYIELRWAELRLGVVRSFYEGLVQSLPPKAAANVHPAPKDRGSIKSLRFADFNVEEQAAIKNFVHDEASAIGQLEAIVTAKRGSGEATHLLIAYLKDLSRRAEINRWLRAELRAAFDAGESEAKRDLVALPAHGDPLQAAGPAEVQIEKASASPSAEPSPEGAVWPSRGAMSRREPQKAAQLREWLSTRGTAIRNLLVEDGDRRISLREPPRAKPVRDMFEDAIDDPGVQTELRRLLGAVA